jgi:deoxyribose-phosphate aldolase
MNHPIEIDLAPLIDHTFLNPVACPQQIAQYCDQAQRYQFATVCVYPNSVRFVTEQLRGKSPQVCTVIGFPAGATTSAVKLYEAQEAVENGATELDVMVNLSWIKQGQTQKLYREIAEIVEETGQTVKAIIETAVLTDDEKRLAAEVLIDTGGNLGTNQYGMVRRGNRGRCAVTEAIFKSPIGNQSSGSNSYLSTGG